MKYSIVYHLRIKLIRASPTPTRKPDTAFVCGPGDQSADTDAGAGHATVAAYISDTI